MSIVLKTFFPFFTILSFYTKHMFKFIYVNQVIHMVILVDNVDKFVHNLIIGGFADFCHVENFLESFSLIHHGSTSFVHIAIMVFWGCWSLHLHVSSRSQNTSGKYQKSSGPFSQWELDRSFFFWSDRYLSYSSPFSRISFKAPSSATTVTSGWSCRIDAGTLGVIGP